MKVKKGQSIERSKRNNIISKWLVELVLLVYSQEVKMKNENIVRK